jgi:hypothetical protein
MIRKVGILSGFRRSRAIEDADNLKLQVLTRMASTAFHLNPARLTFVHSFDVINADQHL